MPSLADPSRRADKVPRSGQEARLIWFTLPDGDSIALAPEHVRYIRPTDDGGTIVHFARDDRIVVTQTPTEVAARLR